MKRIAVATALLGVIVAAPARAAWTFKVETNPMTDAKRGVSLLIGDAGGLAVKCDENGPGTLYLAFISTQYLGGEGWRKNRSVRYRIDKSEPMSIIANHDGSAASVFDVAPASEGGMFLSRLIDSHELVVQLTDFQNHLITIVFDTTGTREAVEKTSSACGDTNWSQRQ